MKSADTKGFDSNSFLTNSLNNSRHLAVDRGQMAVKGAFKSNHSIVRAQNTKQFQVSSIKSRDKWKLTDIVNKFHQQFQLFKSFGN